MTDRYHLSRAGVLNVWQYDEQVFDLADGRLLLRGANGAGKSKTLELLLPFVIDGDKARMTASGRHSTSLVWLMLDGYDGTGRTGYLWVEFARALEGGGVETVTCGVGLRASASARSASTWYFTTTRRIGTDLLLEDSGGPLSKAALQAELERDGTGRFFEQSTRYREHVGQLLFGLPLGAYDDLLRLVYWLRRPQVGEDIDPQKLADQLDNALPSLDGQAVHDVGGTFDDLQAFGEEIEARARAAAAVGDFARTYAVYARAVLSSRLEAVVEASATARRSAGAVRRTDRGLESARTELREVDERTTTQEDTVEQARALARALEQGPEWRSRAQLAALERTVEATAGEVRRVESGHTRAAVDAERTAARAQEEASGLGRLVAGLVEDTRGIDRSTAALGVAGPAWSAGVVGALEWGTEGSESAVVQVTTQVQEWASGRRPVVGERRAAVTAVEAARQGAEAAAREADRAQVDVTRAEERAEAAQARAELAAGESARLEAEFVTELEAWRAQPAALSFELPEMTAQGLELLEAAVAQAVSPVDDGWALAVAEAEAALAAGTASQRELRTERAAVEAARDPEPPAPTWRRSSREGRPGAPFWRLVDFAEALGQGERARVEAALEGSGLLDAWVTPDGSVELLRDDGVADLWVGAANDAPGQGAGRLAAALHLDAEAVGLGVAPAVIEALLARVPLSDSVVGVGGAGLRLGRDGSWGLGPLVGRTAKQTAQYVGASARAGERRRRLAEIDARLERVRADLARSTAARDEAAQERNLLRQWQRARPRHLPLLGAWASQATLESAVVEAQARVDEASGVARQRRGEAAARHTELVRLGETHDLPVDATGLAARREALGDADRALADVVARSGRARERAAQWAFLAASARSDDERLAGLARDLNDARARLVREQAELDELVTAAGSSIAELERRLQQLREQERGGQAQVTLLRARHDELTGSVARLATALDADREREQRDLAASDECRALLLGLRELPGVLRSAQADTPQDLAVMAGDDVAPMTELAQRLGSGADESAAGNAVFAGLNALQSGPAAVHEPRLRRDDDGVVMAIGLDDTGDVDMATLGERLSARVASDRELLSQREREQFERHVLGELGEALRQVRLTAEELVRAMNEQLHGVTTSQGIRVRLRWRVRDDLPVEARRALDLLRQPMGALLPDERAELRDVLHRLIDVSRAQSPEEPYAVHLGRALDYRQWHAFTVQYHRPETGDWRDLQRRTALSQGEQKVLCYLPLFAAAAAHFASVAGAAPYAPRFVLLDDAFPKIDARTHPLLFGLLVDLDLDFVITSERLWGCHETVPALAIYEALRSPSERGIAQYEHRWDGSVLTTVRP